MNEHKIWHFEPYKLTPEWVDGLNPSSSAFVEDLVAEKTETYQESKLIGYADPVEYMMCNYGEMPDKSIFCHGETEIVKIHKTTFRMERETAKLVKEFCINNSYNFRTFCSYLASSDTKFEKRFANVMKYYKIHELSSKYVPSKIFFSKSDKVKKPRYWIASNPYSKVLIVQPDRKKPFYVHYALKDSISSTHPLFTFKFGAKEYKITKVRRTQDVVIVAHSCIYLLKL